MQMYEFFIRAEEISSLVISCICFTIMYFSYESILLQELISGNPPISW